MTWYTEYDAEHRNRDYADLVIDMLECMATLRVFWLTRMALALVQIFQKSEPR